MFYIFYPKITQFYTIEITFTIDKNYDDLDTSKIN
jgi:hypothetical protein